MRSLKILSNWRLIVLYAKRGVGNWLIGNTAVQKANVYNFVEREEYTNIFGHGKLSNIYGGTHQQVQDTTIAIIGGSRTPRQCELYIKMK